MNLSEAINELARFKGVFQAAEKLGEILALAAQADQLQSEAVAIANRVKAEIDNLTAAKATAELAYQDALTRKEAATKEAISAEGRIGNLTRQASALQENVAALLNREAEAADAADKAEGKLGRLNTELTQVQAKLGSANERLDALRAKLEA